MPDPILCDTPTKLQEAVAALSSTTSFAFDTEGRKLGTTYGKLSLISCRLLSGAFAGSTYLVDVLPLSKGDLQPLFSILSDPSVTKIVWDGRMDYSELLHGFGITLRGVLDLQLADVRSRSLRGEGQAQQFYRLSSGRYINRREWAKSPQQYSRIHRIQGLKGAAREFKIGNDRKCSA